MLASYDPANYDPSKFQDFKDASKPLDKDTIKEALRHEDGFFMQTVFDLPGVMFNYYCRYVATLNNHHLERVNYDPAYLKLMNDYVYRMVTRFGEV